MIDMLLGKPHIFVESCLYGGIILVMTQETGVFDGAIKRKEFEVTVNPDCRSSLMLSTWPINVYPDSFGMEGERVSVKRGKSHYALVFYDHEAYVEITREVDEQGTLDKKEVISLPYR